MTCGHVRRLLSAYTDGELSGHEMLRIREHVTLCSGCKCEVEAIRTMKACLNQQPTAEPCDGFEARLMDRVFAKPAVEPRAIPWFSISLAASVAAAAAMFAFLQFSHANQNTMVKGSTSNNPATFNVQQDQAMMVGSDPLSGQAPIYSAGYGGR